MADFVIEREVVIDAPVDVVWRTLTEPEQISQWFADRVELEAKPGGRGTFTFQNEGDATPHTAAIVVESVEAPTHFSFRWSHPEGEEPGPGNSMLVEFTLAEESRERTRLRVVESGVELLGWSESEKNQYADEHRAGWATFLDRLVALVSSRAVDHPSE